ncbi:MAG: hypothetical protein NXI23_16975 [Bacteroidetes bacterium]|jgi:hypothetical protein|nr:hypothetical protein [Bacteroidota bacterium]MDF1868140.1 hypothetical protein [Saprospiraceae bacterium]
MKKLELLKIFLVTGVGLFFTRCDLINPSEGIPSYISISEITVEPTIGTLTGTLSSKITQIRVTVPDPISGVSNTLGTFSLPATIPILLEGTFDIEIDPAIKANGNSFSLEVYPYYEKIISTTTLVPGEIIDLNLTTKYKESIEVEFQEDFEGGDAIFFNRDLEPASPNEIVGFEQGAFEGKSGRIALDKDNAGFIISTEAAFSLDLNQTGAVYMEINYKNDIPIEVGIFGVNALGEDNPLWEFVLVEQENWNKIYLNLTETIQFLNENQFRFGIRGIIPFSPTLGDFTLENAEVLLDNIKVIHF